MKRRRRCASAQTEPLAEEMLGALSMDTTTHHARITGPVSYRAGNGRKQNIPIGPCLVESIDGCLIDIIWGARGQSSVALPVKEIEAAQEHGNLVLLA